MQRSLSHEFAMDEALFWAWFFDETFNRQMYLEHLGFPIFEIVSTERMPDGRIRRRLRAQPRVELPGALRAVLGSSTSYEECGEYDPRRGSFCARYRPAALGRRIEGALEVSTARAPSGLLERRVELSVSAALPALARTLERFILQQTEQMFDASADYMRRRIAERASAA